MTHQHIVDSLNSGKLCTEYICARFESHPPAKDIHSDASSASSRKANSPRDTVTVPTRVPDERNRARQRTSSNARRCFPPGIFHEATFGWQGETTRCSARGMNKFHFARTSGRRCDSRFTIHRFIHMEQQATTPASTTDNFATIRRLYHALSFYGAHTVSAVFNSGQRIQHR